MFEWDDDKNHDNRVKHRLDFSAAQDSAWHEALVFDRTRIKDEEQRFAAVGMLHEKLHTVIFTQRGKQTRIISLRRANKAEEKAYEKNT